MMDLRITKEDSEALGFVVACASAQALGVEEINHWAEAVLMSTDEYPDYMLEICVFNGFLKDIYGIIGFTPVCTLSEREMTALHGIADKRGVSRFEPSPSKKQAQRALESNPHILQRYQEQFRFVQFSA